jgi:hypothetical protein
VARPAGLVAAAHRRAVTRGDVGLDAVTVDRLVRELANQVAGVKAGVRLDLPQSA